MSKKSKKCENLKKYKESNNWNSMSCKNANCNFFPKFTLFRHPQQDYRSEEWKIKTIKNPEGMARL
jgi:hypothetical protein